jgi:hypothetical protein
VWSLRRPRWGLLWPKPVEGASLGSLESHSKRDCVGRGRFGLVLLAGAGLFAARVGAEPTPWPGRLSREVGRLSAVGAGPTLVQTLEPRASTEGPLAVTF